MFLATVNQAVEDRSQCAYAYLFIIHYTLFRWITICVIHQLQCNQHTAYATIDDKMSANN